MKRLSLVLLLVITFITIGCNPTVKQDDAGLTSEIKITKHPNPMNFNRHKLFSLPSYNLDSQDGWQIDLRGYDLSSLIIKDRLNDLMYASFDSKTKWPEGIPDSFNPEGIMELGKSPGLGIDELHKKGITGKGVGIAIIDQALLVDHTEYSVTVM